MQPPKTLTSECRYAGRVFDLVVEEIEYPSGNRSVREIARHPGGAVIVPLLNDGSVILVRQYRYPFHQYVVELPAGKLEAGEDPRHCAERELEEETGYGAASFTRLTAIYTTPGFCSEVLHIYLAQGLRPGKLGQRLEEGEQTLTLMTVPLPEALAMIERGEIVDAKTISGLFLASRRLAKREIT